MNAVALLLLVAVAHLLPAHMAAIAGGTHAAWETVCYGIEAAALWTWAAARQRQTIARAVAAWGAIESAQRSTCRLLLPMDRKAALAPGQNLCDAATGLPVSVISLAALAIVVMFLAGGKRGGF